MNKIIPIPLWDISPSSLQGVEIAREDGYIASCCGAYSCHSIEQWLGQAIGISVYIGEEDVPPPENNEWHRHFKIPGIGKDIIYIKELLKGCTTTYNEDEDEYQADWPFSFGVNRVEQARYAGTPKNSPYCTVHLSSGYGKRYYQPGLLPEIAKYKLAFFIYTKDQAKDPRCEFGLDSMNSMPTYWESPTWVQNGNYPEGKPNLKLCIKEINHETRL